MAVRQLPLLMGKI